MSKFMLFTCYRANINLKMSYSRNNKQVNTCYSVDDKRLILTCLSCLLLEEQKIKCYQMLIGMQIIECVFYWLGFYASLTGVWLAFVRIN